MKQTEVLAWPGTPSAALTTTDAILVSSSFYKYSIVDTHKPQTIKFFIVSRESRGVELLTATEITFDVICGMVSTTILAPPILQVTVSDYLLMRGLD
jgi:hypothetical protein